MKLQINHHAGLSLALLTAGWLSLPVVVHARLQGAGAAPDMDDAGPEPRELQQRAPPNIVTVDTWDDCVDMTPTECRAYILETNNGDLSNNAIPSLNMLVSPARTHRAISKSYWQFGIRTTVTGEVDCNLNNGEVRFRRDWETLEGTYTLAPVDCAGLQATHCCEKVIATMEERRIPLVDVRGNCLSCRTHQLPLEPHVVPGMVNESFVSHTFKQGECKAKMLTRANVHAEDAIVATALVGVRADIVAVLHAETVLCKDMIFLHHRLLTYARSLPHIMAKVVGMLCGACDMLHSDPAAELKGGLSDNARSDLKWMHNELAAAVIRSDISDIIMYTDDSRSKVLKTPVVGGSRTGEVTETEPKVRRGVCVAPAVSDGNGGCECTSVPGMESDGLYRCKCHAGEFWDITSQTCYVCTAPSQVIVLDDGLSVCECPAATMENLQVYWEGTWKNTEANTKCMCPPGHALVELDHTCFCPGGYKLWDVETQSCHCPHGLQEDGKSCICPGPHSNLDWNNVGWLDNGHGSCKVDFDCSLSPKDYYSDFKEGCSTCKQGYDVDPNDGRCVLNCRKRGEGLVYSRYFDECICEHKALKFNTLENKCMCEGVGMEYNEAKEECECPAGFVQEHTYVNYEIVYKCTPEDTGGAGSYYNYGNYH